MMIGATIRTFVLWLCAVALPVMITGCGPAAIDQAYDGNATRTPTPLPAADDIVKASPEATALAQQIDPEPAAANGAPTIVTKEDVTSASGPACAFTIRYPGHVDQDVTWAKEACADIETRFLTDAEMKERGLLDKLDDEARENVRRLADGGVFYVESRFTASLFPLNVAGVAYEIPVRD
jgi:hypothetical protein